MQHLLTDTELVRRAKAGDLESFEALVGRYERQVYHLARRIVQQVEDAEDVTQETFLSVLENLGGFREEASFRTWITRIATHAALRVLRKRKGLPVVPLELQEHEVDEENHLPHPQFIADWRENPEQRFEQGELRRILEQALAELDEKYRLVFLLRDVEGLPVKETAAVLGLTESNVKVRLLRARLQLRERLTREFGDESGRILPDHHHG